ncbi:redoxin domain-containing protein [Caballeronia arationis]|jgi:thiol-disulfide isomerase/thioredoxin|uniref:Cytochrome oxidase Cu insertion factor, SCO1/SenC/PrrC family n=1 Tax=Caballeronia arationis TaxID=1777142 RepID=A0A7Z7I6Z0_9BURK|nr:thioredoxin family protein [Caballeronia arationis]SAL04909.1 redoxin domain-containing protein [Caballeronia arationis]SOE62078.1 Cytochrome oxidase Cu insertion factor, SCO1/SenC/PrrC family [Caballeronia arationis]
MLSRLKTVAALTVFAAVAATSGAAIAGTPANTKAAPEFTGIETWINSDPLTLSQLRGKVVLVDFWTYSCINCIHTLPQVQSWNQKFKDQGLVVVGVHTPEFPFERDTGNVKTAVKRFGITFPVAQDNRYATWRAYDNQYWPAFYLIDKKGQVAYSHFGEGDYAQTENAIKALLAQK